MFHEMIMKMKRLTGVFQWSIQQQKLELVFSHKKKNTKLVSLQMFAGIRQEVKDLHGTDLHLLDKS